MPKGSRKSSKASASGNKRSQGRRAGKEAKRGVTGGAAAAAKAASDRPVGSRSAARSRPRKKGSIGRASAARGASPRGESQAAHPRKKQPPAANQAGRFDISLDESQVEDLDLEERFGRLDELATGGEEEQQVSGFEDLDRFRLEQIERTRGSPEESLRFVEPKDPGQADDDER